MIIRIPLMRQASHMGEGVQRGAFLNVVLDESKGGSLTPRRSSVCLSSVPACPSIYCHPKEAGRARGEWACCGFCHHYPTVTHHQGSKMPWLKG